MGAQRVVVVVLVPPSIVVVVRIVLLVALVDVVLVLVLVVGTTLGGRELVVVVGHGSLARRGRHTRGSLSVSVLFAPWARALSTIPCFPGRVFPLSGTRTSAKSPQA